MPDHGLKIFLDACCVIRQFDDQSQPRIRYETEALASIISWVQNRELIWIGSDALRIELGQSKKSDSRETALFLIDTFCECRAITDMDRVKANDLRKLGFKSLDALHLAAADNSKCDVFLTTDDRLMKGAKRWKRERDTRSRSTTEKNTQPHAC